MVYPYGGNGSALSNNVPRNMPPLNSGNAPQSWVSQNMNPGGVAPGSSSQPPKFTMNGLSGTNAQQPKTFGLSGPAYGNVGAKMSQSAPIPQSAPIETPDAGRLASVAGGLNTFKNFIAAPSFGAAAATAIPAYVAGRTANQLVNLVYDKTHGIPNPIQSAGQEARNAAKSAFSSGDYSRALGEGVRATGQTVSAMGKDMLAPFGSFLGGVVNAAPASATSASQPPVTVPNAPPNLPTMARPGTPSVPVSTGGAPFTSREQSLSERFPDRFKGVPSFRDTVAGGNNYKLPLTPEERLYNAEVLKGIQLDNRARELANVSRYRAEQLHDPAAFATLNVTHGGPGQMAHGLQREETNPEYRYNVNSDRYDAGDKSAALQEAVTSIFPDLGEGQAFGRNEDSLSRQKYMKLIATWAALGGSGSPPAYEELAAMRGIKLPQEQKSGWW